MIALAPAMARLNAGEELDKTFKELEKGVVGGKSSQIVIDFAKNEFSGYLNLKDLDMKGYVVSDTSKTAYSYNSSQEKIDVNLEWGGKILPVSAKNVNLNSNRYIHILSNSSLLYLLQDENNDMVNHYLNMVTVHKDKVSIKGDIAGAHEAIKYTILFKALSGQTYGRSGAKVFIVNNNATGKVKVYDIKALINKAMEDLKAYTYITANGKNIERMKIANDWVESGYSARLTNVIGEVHKQKISAALKPALLR